MNRYRARVIVEFEFDWDEEYGLAEENAEDVFEQGDVELKDVILETDSVQVVTELDSPDPMSVAKEAREG